MFIPQGFRFAAWNRDSSKIYAKQLVTVDRVDIMVTMGPWAAEDLLEAGYKKPIISMYRYDLANEGLLNNVGQPKATNLTLTGQGGIIERDLVTLIRLTQPKRIGVVFFHDSGTGEETIGQMLRVCQKFKVELEVEEAYNNFGTFAFFAAYHKLSKKIDALYLPPLWGMDAIKIDEFLRAVKTDRVPVLSSEGSYMVDHGALVSNAGYDYLSEARVAALKIERIRHGEHPNDLPVFIDAPSGLAINVQTAAEINAKLPLEAINEAILYGSEIPLTADAYSLTQAVHRTIAAHPTALAADLRLNAAIDNGKTGLGILDPRLSFQGDVTRRSNEYVNNSHNWLKKSGTRGELTFETTLLSLENLRLSRLAQREKLYEEANRQAALGNLETATALAYSAIVESEEMIRVYREGRLAIERNLELAKLTRSYEHSTDETEQMQWESRRIATMTRLTSAYFERKRARALFNTLLNLPATTPITLDSLQFSERELYDNYTQMRQHVVTSADEARVRSFLLQEAKKGNPAYQASAASIDVTNSLIAQRNGRRWPTFGVYASGFYTDEQADITDEFTEEDFSWTIGGRLRWSFPSSFSERREKRILKAEQQVQEYSRDSLSLALLGNIESGVSNLLEQMNNIPMSMQWRKASLAEYQKLAQGYEAGTTNLQNVVMAHEQAEEASLQAISERFEYYRKLAELTNQLGWRSGETSGTYVSEFFRRLNAGLPAPAPATP
jgi:outer membrane protein TolC/ABC-type uncharacterized transport system substrate-binding protein